MAIVHRFVPQGSSPNELLNHNIRAFDEIYNLYARINSLGSSIKAPTSLSSIVQALAAGGSNALNVTGLNGLLSQPQYAGVPVVTSLPVYGSPLAQSGQLISYNGQLYIYDTGSNAFVSNSPGAFSPGNWISVNGLIFYGTRLQRFKFALKAPSLLWWETDTHQLWMSIAISQTTFLWMFLLGDAISDLYSHHVDVTNTCNVSGVTVTLTSGTTSPAWAGRKIVINGLFNAVTAVADSTHFTVLNSMGTLIGVACVFNYWSAFDYLPGLLYFATDPAPTLYRTLHRTVSPSAFTVTITGNSVVTGSDFNPYLAGTPVLISGLFYAVAHVDSATTLTLTTTPVTQGVTTMTTNALGWQYSEGAIEGQLSVIPGLAFNPVFDSGMRFLTTDFGSVHVTTGVSGVWAFAPEDPGHDYYVLGSDSSPQSASGYFAPCNGSTYQVATGDGSVLTRVTPDFLGAGVPSPLVQLGIYAGGIMETATAPQWDAAARTDNDSGSQVVQSGVGASVPDEPHTHALTNTNAIIKPPSDTNGGMAARIKFALYLRI